MSWLRAQRQRLERVRDLHTRSREIIEPYLQKWQGQKPETVPADELEYGELREDWLGEADWLRDLVDSLWDDDDLAPWRGYGAIERALHYQTLAEAADQLVAYDRKPENVRRHTWDEATSFFIRVTARLQERAAAEPTWLSKVARSPSRFADWLEAHPQTVRLGFWLAIAVLAWQAPSILRELADFASAIRGL